MHTCSLSFSDNNIPLINVSAYSQANLSDQNIICLLDSGADVDYVDSNLIEAMHLNNKKYIITCINCLTCSGVQNNCHPILGLINLTINYTDELGSKHRIAIKAHIVNSL